MIIKIKCYRLKDDVDIKELEKYDFKPNSVGNYTRTIDGWKYVIYYNDTKRFVIRNYPDRIGRASKVSKFIKDLIDDDLVYKVDFYYWLAIIGSYKNYSDKKLDRIEKKLNKLNKMEEQS